MGETLFRYRVPGGRFHISQGEILFRGRLYFVTPTLGVVVQKIQQNEAHRKGLRYHPFLFNPTQIFLFLMSRHFWKVCSSHIPIIPCNIRYDNIYWRPHDAHPKSGSSWPQPPQDWRLHVCLKDSWALRLSAPAPIFGLLPSVQPFISLELI